MSSAVVKPTVFSFHQRSKQMRHEVQRGQFVSRQHLEGIADKTFCSGQLYEQTFLLSARNIVYASSTGTSF